MKKKTDFKTIRALFWIFFKAGAFTFAGGLAMLPLIKRDVIDQHHMMDEDEFLEYVAISQSLPGVVSLNCAVFVGKRASGIKGAIAAALGTILPAFAAMLAVTILVSRIPKSGVIEGAFKGIRAASAALILAAAVELGKKCLKNAFGYILALLVFAAILIFKFDVFPVVIAAGVAAISHGAFIRKRNPSSSQTGQDEDHMNGGGE